MTTLTYDQRKARVKDLLAQQTYTARWFIVEAYAQTVKGSIKNGRKPSREGKLAYLHILCTNGFSFQNSWS